MFLWYPVVTFQGSHPLHPFAAVHWGFDSAQRSQTLSLDDFSTVYCSGSWFGMDPGLVSTLYSDHSWSVVSTCFNHPTFWCWPSSFPCRSHLQLHRAPGVPFPQALEKRNIIPGVKPHLKVYVLWQNMAKHGKTWQNMAHCNHRRFTKPAFVSKKSAYPLVIQHENQKRINHLQVGNSCHSCHS